MYRSPWPTAPFFLSFLLPPLAVICVSERGWWSFAPLALAFVLLPLGDRLLGVADQWREAPDLAFNKYFRLVTWLWVPLQLLLLYWVLRQIGSGRLSPLEIAGATIAMGLIAGFIGATFGHELIHRRYRLERYYGYLPLVMMTYAHYGLVHIPGHHRWVGTPGDPGTARLNESFYRFLFRAIAGNVRTALAFEEQRLRRNNKTASANRVYRSAALEAACYGAMWAWGGPVVALAFLGQSLVAIVIVEAINYIQHYGLRREVTNGGHERVAPYHTWDSPYRLTNWLLINLPRHADHHCSPNKRYQTLELLPQAPRLPAGYGALVLAALVPPLWFSIMNPRVAAAARLARP